MDAINEKPLFGGGARGGARVSRLLHAVFGIDHYNGGHYLAKLPLPALLALRDDMSSMQELLQDAIAHKLQEAALPRAVIPVPEALLYDWLDPAVIHLLQSVGAAAASNTPQTNLFPEPTRVIPWHRFVTEEAPGVFSFPMFTPHACAALLDMVDSRSLLTTGDSRRHAVLDVMGLGAVQDLILRVIIQPLCRAVYPSLASNLNYRYGYVIGYTAAHSQLTGDDSPASPTAPAPVRVHVPASSVIGVDMDDEDMAAASGAQAVSGATSAAPAEAAEGSLPAAHAAHPATHTTKALLTRSALVRHTDDSEVTLNISLGRSFTGGDLLFRGLRYADDSGMDLHSVKPVPGRAIMHLGQQLHEVTEVTSGERFAYIMWARNGDYRDTHCPCCVIHGRNPCVCGPELN